MTPFFLNFQQHRNQVFCRFIDRNGKRITTIDEYSPTLYVKSNKESTLKSMKGDNLVPMKFDSIREGKEFLKQYEGVVGMDVFGNSSFAYAYVAEKFQVPVEYDESLILINFLDIETEVVLGGFPNPRDAAERVSLITISSGTKFITWGLKPLETEETDYRYCATEQFLLQSFVNFINGNCPDVITGWNSNGFDIPYLVRRISKILGPEETKRLSPIGNVYEKYDTLTDSYSYKIGGIALIDYLELFKKYVPGERESYKLDDIAFEVLGANKLDHSEFGSFQEFQDNAWPKFTEYNIHDVRLIVDMEKKKKLLSQHISVAYMAGVNFEDVFSPVKTWDFFIQNELVKENTFVNALYSPGGEVGSIEGAYVKDPIVGRHEWVVSLDANSLYPSNIRSVNISSETIVEYDALPLELREFYLTHSVESLVNNIEMMKPLLKKHNLSFAPNGSFYRRDQSHIGKIVTRVYGDRSTAKKQMIEKKKERQLIEIEIDRRSKV